MLKILCDKNVFVSQVEQMAPALPFHWPWVGEA